MGAVLRLATTRSAYTGRRIARGVAVSPDDFPPLVSCCTTYDAAARERRRRVRSTAPRHARRGDRLARDGGRSRERSLLAAHADQSEQCSAAAGCVDLSWG